eukprot:354335-Chlamydomonas_euryale.AAC.5
MTPSTHLIGCGHLGEGSRPLPKIERCAGTEGGLRTARTSAYPVEYRRAHFWVDDPFTGRKCSVEWGPK